MTLRRLVCVVISSGAAAAAFAGPIDVAPPQPDAAKADASAPGATFAQDDVRLAAYSLDLARLGSYTSPATSVPEPAGGREPSRDAVPPDSHFLADILLPAGTTHDVLARPTRSAAEVDVARDMNARFTSSVGLEPTPAQRRGGVPWIEPVGWSLAGLGVASTVFVLGRRQLAWWRR